MYITTTEYTPDLKDHETPKGRPTSRQLHSNEVTVIQEVSTQCMENTDYLNLEYIVEAFLSISLTNNLG